MENRISLSLISIIFPGGCFKLSWLFNSAFRLGQINLGGLRIFVGTIVIVTVVTLEELTQLWIPTRHFELMDLLADYLGIATAEIALRRKSIKFY